MPDLQTIECLYVGRRVLANGKLAEGYVPAEAASGVPPDDWATFESLKVSLFEAAKRSKGSARSAAVVGGVYKIEAELVDGRINKAKTASREFVRRFENKPAVLACQTRDDAADTHARAARMMAKLVKDDSLTGELRMLRNLYRRTPYADKMALELLVLKSLREP